MQSREIQKRCYNFVIGVIKMTKKLNKNTVSDILIKQIVRSSTSIGANIVEAQAGSSKKDFINFIHHSLKSANETKFWLEIIKDTERTDPNEMNFLIKECYELANILGASLVTLKK